MSARQRAISFSWAWAWTRRRRWLGSSEIGPSPGEKTLEDFGIKVRLGRILVRPDRHREGVVRIVKLCFNRGDLVLLHEEKIAVHLGRQIVLLVISHPPEIIEHPRQRIRARANYVSNQLVGARIGVGQLQQQVRALVNVVVGLHINVRLSVGGAAKIVQPDAISEGASQQDCGYNIDHSLIY